jgi:hypothetical protein
MTAVNSHAIGNAWNMDAEDLTLITSLTDSAGNTLHPPRALGTYDAGTLEPRGDYGLTVTGVSVVRWEWLNVERGFRKVLRDLYCGTSIDDHSGQVTIYTPLEEPDVYFLCNATVYVPKISELPYDGSTDWFERFALTFTIEEILTP